MPRDKTLVPPVVLGTLNWSMVLLFSIHYYRITGESESIRPLRLARTNFPICSYYMGPVSKSHVRYRLFFFAFVTYNGSLPFGNSQYRYIVSLIAHAAAIMNLKLSLLTGTYRWSGV